MMLLIRTRLPFIYLFPWFFPRRQERGTESGVDWGAKSGEEVGEAIFAAGDGMISAAGDMDAA